MRLCVNKMNWIWLLFPSLSLLGLPNASNKYVFNGDFVDRGEHGLEVVIVLFAMFASTSDGGDTVFLNRGNHEDVAVCRVYGFENEVTYVHTFSYTWLVG